MLRLKVIVRFNVMWWCVYCFLVMAERQDERTFIAGFLKNLICHGFDRFSLEEWIITAPFVMCSVSSMAVPEYVVLQICIASNLWFTFPVPSVWWLKVVARWFLWQISHISNVSMDIYDSYILNGYNTNAQ